jgi:AGZA family xanthine/uracil permease-like MFS transporter
MDRIRRFFHIKEYGASISTEVIGGITTFVSMSYVLFVNPAILVAAGVDPGASFIATALTALICTAAMALARTPLAMAPGMGLNTFIVYTVCAVMGFKWQEALAIVFIAGVLHVLLMVTPSGKHIMTFVPNSLRAAVSVGIGLFIAFIGLRNAGLLSYTFSPGAYVNISETVVGDSTTVPAMFEHISPANIVAIVGFLVMLIVLTFEKKLNSSFAALVIGILAATFIGLPLGVTQTVSLQLLDLSALSHWWDSALSLFGDPGLLSLFSSGGKALNALFAIGALLLMNMCGGVSTVMSLEQYRRDNSRIKIKAVKSAKAEENTADAKNADEIKDANENENEKVQKHIRKIVTVNAAGGVVAALMGTTTATTYGESVTGIVAGARTGLSSAVTALLLLLSLPFYGIIEMIPSAAVAPALVIAGSALAYDAAHINWKDFTESFPAFMVILVMTLSYNMMDGISVGVISYVIIHLALGKRKKISLVMYVVALLFVALVTLKSLLL